MSLTLTNIPKIMRSQGWIRGATLMTKWFNGPAVQVPHYASTDTSTIKMRWVLGYRSPKELYDSIFRERIWANDAARKILAKRLQSWGKLSKSQQRFDQTVMPASLLESEYINYRSYNASGQAYVLSDLVAALGAFNFRVVVAGSVVPALPGPYQVTITKVGVFVRDSFDFEGFQFLGFWDDSDNSVSAFNPLSGTAVFNSTFREYRKQHGRGGDLLVFSDVLVTTLNPPHTFTL